MAGRGGKGVNKGPFTDAEYALVVQVCVMYMYIHAYRCVCVCVCACASFVDGWAGNCLLPWPRLDRIEYDTHGDDAVCCACVVSTTMLESPPPTKKGFLLLPYPPPVRTHTYTTSYQQKYRSSTPTATPGRGASPRRICPSCWACGRRRPLGRGSSGRLKPCPCLT
jgi:hypothetical protein